MHQNELKNLKIFKGISFYYISCDKENKVGNLLEENVKSIIRQQASFLVKKLGGELTYRHDQSHYVIIDSDEMFSDDNHKVNLESLGNCLNYHMKHSILKHHKQYCEKMKIALTADFYSTSKRKLYNLNLFI